MFINKSMHNVSVYSKNIINNSMCLCFLIFLIVGCSSPMFLLKEIRKIAMNYKDCKSITEK